MTGGHLLRSRGPLCTKAISTNCGLATYTVFHKKNTPLAFLLYLSQLLLNDNENWNKYSSVKWL